jgi:hypothetical protein
MEEAFFHDVAQRPSPKIKVVHADVHALHVTSAVPAVPVYSMVISTRLDLLEHRWLMLTMLDTGNKLRNGKKCRGLSARAS